MDLEEVGQVQLHRVGATTLLSLNSWAQPYETSLFCSKIGLTNSYETSLICLKIGLTDFYSITVIRIIRDPHALVPFVFDRVLCQ